MKKTAIIYKSIHHKNTEKVVRTIAKEFPVDVFKVEDIVNLDFKDYETIVVASGIYFNKIHKDLIKWLEIKSLEGKEIAVVYTYGIRFRDYCKSIKRLIEKKASMYLGGSWCRGYDTSGFLAKLGGIAKNHPTDLDILKIKKQVEGWIL